MTPGRLARRFARVIALAFAVAFGPAHAVLGEPIAAQRMTLAAGSGLRVAHTRHADGSALREYVDAQGVVCGIAWNSRLKPDLATLLGRHAATWEAALAAQPQRAGRRAVAIERDDLVVESAGRMNAFVGRAWLRSRCEAGGRDALR